MASIRYIVTDIDRSVVFYRDSLEYRFTIVTKDIDGLVGRLDKAGARFKGEISEAGAGRARLLEDPSGNLVELFEFKKK